MQYNIFKKAARECQREIEEYFFGRKKKKWISSKWNTPLKEENIIDTVEGLCRYINHSGDPKILLEFIIKKVNLLPYLLKILERVLYLDDYIGRTLPFYSINTIIDHAPEFLNPSLFNNLLDIFLKVYPSYKKYFLQDYNNILHTLALLLKKTPQLFQPRDFELIHTLLISLESLGFRPKSANKIQQEIVVFNNYLNALGHLDAFLKTFDLDNLCSTMETYIEDYDPFIVEICSGLFQVSFQASTLPQKRAFFDRLLTRALQPKWQASEVGQKLLAIAIGMNPELFTQQDMDSVITTLLHPANNYNAFSSALGLLEIACNWHPQFIQAALPTLKQMLFDTDLMFDDPQAEFRLVKEGALQILGVLFKNAPSLVTQELLHILFTQLEEEEERIIFDALQVIIKAFEGMRGYLAQPLAQLQARFRDSHVPSRLAAVLDCKALLENTPWFIEAADLTRINNILATEEKYYIPTEGATALIETISATVLPFFEQVLPLLTQMLTDPAPEVVKQVLPLLRLTLQRISQCIDLTASHGITDPLDAYCWYLQDLPQDFHPETLERISAFVQDPDFELKVFAMYLCELTLSRTPQLISAGNVEAITHLNSTEDPALQRVLLYFYQKLCEQRPDLVSEAITSYISQFISGDYYSPYDPEEESNLIATAARKVFPFLDHTGHWRGDASDFDFEDYWNAELVALRAYKALLQHAPHLITSIGLEQALQFLTDPYLIVKREALEIYESARQTPPPSIGSGQPPLPPLFEFSYCPECGKQIIRGFVEGPRMPYRFETEAWVTHSMADLLRLATLTCESCTQQIPLAQFPEEFQTFWIEQVLAPRKDAFTEKFANIRPLKITIVDETLYKNKVHDPLSGKWFNDDLRWSTLLHTPKAFGIKAYCTHCLAELTDWSYIELDKVIECNACESYLTLALPDGLVLPKENKDLFVSLG